MKQENEVKPKRRILKIFIKLLIVVVLLVGVAFAVKLAPNYITKDITDRNNLIINYSNVTGRMKHDLIIDENGVVYLSFEDIMNYYDKHIYYDEQYDQIVTSTETKLAVLKLNENKKTVNGATTTIKGTAILKDDVYYLPISEMQDVYNLKVTKVGNKVVLESLDRKLTTAVLSKNTGIKYKATVLSKTIEKMKKGDKIVIAEVEPALLPDGWVKVRTENGNIGYIEEKNLENKTVERKETIYENQIDGKISLAWDYFSEYGKAPDNTGIQYDGVNVVSPSFFTLKLQDTGKEKITTLDVVSQARVIPNIGDEGIKYIQWAHDNNYKVWAKFSNETLSTTIDEFSYIINDYKLRELMINDILNYVEKYNLDGINLDFEYMYQNDNEAFSRFIIELAPQLRAKNVCLSVDVTAPNGGENWSLCYNRNLIGEVADYIVFMGYDQYGTNKIGTTAGYNWLNNNIKYFLDTEEVPSEKLIVGLPFYTKLWQTKGDETIKGTPVAMSNVENSIPAYATKEWKEDLQQYYVQYEQNGYTYKMWIEDETSFSKKLELVEEYDLAGAAYWRKGLETKEIWKIIKQILEL